MKDNLSRLPAAFAAAAMILLGLSGQILAGTAEPSVASQHVLQAEVALHQMKYKEAAHEYRLAAEAGESVDIARQATRIGASYGFNDDALHAAERWLELEPDSDEALFHLARLQLRMGDTRKAKRSYEKLLEQGEGEPAERLLSLTGVLGEEEDTEAAYKVLRDLAKPYKDSPIANFAVATLALRADDIKEAKSLVETALEQDPGEWLEMKAKLLYGRILLQEGDPDAAIAYVARLIGDDPQPDPAKRMELALLMLSAGREDDALSQVNQIQYESGNNADALRLMAIINFQQENLDAAWEDFEDLLASGEHSMDALYYLARIADYRGQVDRAIGLYSQVKNGSRAVGAQGRAAALVALQKHAPETAIKQLDEFAREQPQFAIDVIQSKAQLLAALDKYPEALELYDRMVEYRPDSQSVALGRAELLLRMGELDESIDQYRKTLKRWPDSALALNALGYTLADRTDDYREAERLIKKALKLDPDNPAIIDSYGWVLHKLGRNQDALVELKKAYASFDDPEVAAHIVEVLAALDRDEEAAKMLATAVEKSPESPLLKSVRERLYPDSQ
ncbi:MAG TPA: tetratricopeptide repeat protein [Woeseiaceae bacterium]|nr:tetratricopeptide repeat protein [Woeseiaceae bacterium]